MATKKAVQGMNEAGEYLIEAAELARRGKPVHDLRNGSLTAARGPALLSRAANASKA